MDGFAVMGGPLVFVMKVALIAVVCALGPLGLKLWLADVVAHVRDMRAANKRRERLDAEIMGEYQVVLTDGWPNKDERTYVEVARRVGVRPSEVSYVISRSHR